MAAPGQTTKFLDAYSTLEDYLLEGVNISRALPMASTPEELCDAFDRYKAWRSSFAGEWLLAREDIPFAKKTTFLESGGITELIQRGVGLDINADWAVKARATATEQTTRWMSAMRELRETNIRRLGFFEKTRYLRLANGKELQISKHSDTNTVRLIKALIKEPGIPRTQESILREFLSGGYVPKKDGGTKSVVAQAVYAVNRLARKEGVEELVEMKGVYGDVTLNPQHIAEF